MFERIKRLLGVKTRNIASENTRLRTIKARYDAAITNSENRRYWANADFLSANTANDAETRRNLRARSRYEVSNNSYARGILSTLANDCIGTGPRLQMLSESRDDNRQVEMAFFKWTQAVHLAEKLRLIRMAKGQDGEAFAILAANPAIQNIVQLDVRPIEADQIATPSFSFEDKVDGIEFDQFNNPIFYHVLHEHPGESLNYSGFMEFDRVPAEAMLHFYTMNRPGQARGIPDLMPALPLFAQLRRYTLAVLAAAETAADYAGILQTTAPPGEDREAATPGDEWEINKRSLVVAPDGYTLAQFKAEQPTTTYGEFKHEILNEIARCLNMPFNVAAGNSSTYNYSSGRLDHQVYFKAIRVEQTHIEEVILNRIFAAWMDEAMFVPGLLPVGMQTFADWNYQWFWDGTPHVDPQKEANAQATRLLNHTTTLAKEYANEGLDWEEALQQCGKEAELMTKLGLTIPGQTPAATEEPEEEEVDEPQMEEAEAKAVYRHSGKRQLAS